MRRHAHEAILPVYGSLCSIVKAAVSLYRGYPQFKAVIIKADSNFKVYFYIVSTKSGITFISEITHDSFVSNKVIFNFFRAGVFFGFVTTLPSKSGYLLTVNIGMAQIDFPELALGEGEERLIHDESIYYLYDSHHSSGQDDLHAGANGILNNLEHTQHTSPVTKGLDR